MLKGCSKIILMLPLLSMAASAGEIKGAIKDGKTKEAVPGATVFVRGGGLPADGLNAMSETGTFSFPNLKAGTYTISADFAGAKDEKTVTITDEQTLNVDLNVNMKQAVAETYKIETTGSRLPTQPSKAVSPVATIDAEDIKATGSTKVEDVVNQMPQAFASQGSTVSNGSNGTATVNLRNLGSARTLVLIDGRRLGPGNPSSGVPAVGDLNFIPAPLVERVDVLTGGSSAVYGADAVAGVTNFIMKKNFEGVQLDVGWDFFQHTQQEIALQALVANRARTNPAQFIVPGNNWQPMGPSASLTIGINSPDGKGNVTAYGTYRKDNGVLQKDYDYAACALAGDTNVPPQFATQTCGGSSTASPPRITDDNGSVTLQNVGGVSGIRRFRRATDQFNFNPLNYYQRPDERWNLGAFAHYKLASFADVYSQGMFMNDVSNYQIGPGGLFYGDPAVVNCGNPFLKQNNALWQRLCGVSGGFYTPVQVASPTHDNDQAGGPDGILLGKRNTEGGGRAGFFTHNEYRYVFGVKGDLGSNWNYDVYHQYMASDFLDKETKYFNLDKVARALNAVPDPNDSTRTVCASSLLPSTDPNFDPDCVPYNVFNLGADGTTAGIITQNQLDYLQTPGIAGGRVSERVINANIAGNLLAYGIKSPLSCEGIAVSAGAEYRHQSLSVFSDSTLKSGKLSGSGGKSGPDVDVNFTVVEGFGEIRIPLVSDLTAMKSLAVEGAYRYSNYSFGKQTNTLKVGGVWEFMDNMRVRGSYQRAVRAPSLAELYAPNLVQLDGATDPCALQGATVNAANNAIAASCVAAFPNTFTGGFTPYDLAPSPAGQYNGFTGGNANLNPELSDTIALGVFLQPSFIPGLQVSVDYFNIAVNQAIGIIGADLILRNCLADRTALSPTGATWCSLVRRDPGTGLTQGSLWLSSNGFVTDTNFNLGNTRTDGLDIFAGYDFDTKSFGGANLGRVYLAGNGTWLNRLTTQPLPTGNSYDCAGLYGNTCINPSPAWRHKLRATWDMPFGLSVSAQWRFISSVMLDALSNDPQLNNPAQQFATDLLLRARNYLDVSASYTWNDMLTFRFGVNNVIDQDPPIVGGANNPIAGGGNGNTIPQVYDSMGRYFFMNATAKF